MKVFYIVFPGCRVLLDAVHVDRYFRDKVFGGKKITTSLYAIVFSLEFAFDLRLDWEKISKHFSWGGVLSTLVVGGGVNQFQC